MKVYVGWMGQSDEDLRKVLTEETHEDLGEGRAKRDSGQSEPPRKNVY